MIMINIKWSSSSFYYGDEQLDFKNTTSSWFLDKTHHSPSNLECKGTYMKALGIVREFRVRQEPFQGARTAGFELKVWQAIQGPQKAISSCFWVIGPFIHQDFHFQANPIMDWAALRMVFTLPVVLPFPPDFLLVLTTVDGDPHITTIHITHWLPDSEITSTIYFPAYATFARKYCIVHEYPIIDLVMNLIYDIWILKYSLLTKIPSEEDIFWKKTYKYQIRNF